MIDLIEEEFLPYELILPLIKAEFPYQNILFWKGESVGLDQISEKCYPLITINQALTWIRCYHFYNIVITEAYYKREINSSDGYTWEYTLNNLITHEEEYFSRGYSSWEEAAMRGIEKLIEDEKI